MMDRRLTENEIQYLLDHLEPLYSGASLRQYMWTFDADNLGNSPVDSETESAALFFPLSAKGLEVSEVITMEEVPVLFPCSNQQHWYSLKGQQVYFHHDILKSAFYLLSGYQEYHLRDRDAHGRFPWKSSVQYLLGVTHKPLVNYYFEVILEAFEKYCRRNKLEFKRKAMSSPLLFLSHDIDRIKKYTLRNLVISVLQLIGIKQGSNGFLKQFKLVIDYAWGMVLFRKNPYWTFNEMSDLEQDLHISSTWFFLEKTKKDNSRYHFNQPKIRNLIEYLFTKGHEIGIHGTLESSTEEEEMKEGIRRLNAVCSIPVSGIRQHFLLYDLPVTTRIQIAAGLDYDSTLGFAEQPGFRNSYAYPFRLYDFDNEEPAGIWQLPLNVMDVTLIEYMNVPVEAFSDVIRALLVEVSRFKGVFSLLWHNCRLDEKCTPGIKLVYRQLLQEVMLSGYKSVTGREAVELFRSAGASGRSWSA